MATSNTYTFGSNTQVDDLLRESFERIGLIGDIITSQKIQSAIMSANLELTSWQGRIPLSWTEKRFLLSVYPGQPTYQLPSTITQVIDVIGTQPTRLNTGGIATSSNGGTVNNCFDPTTTAGCIQTAANGWISYDYGNGNPKSIQYVGITPLQTQSAYTIAIEYSFDNVNWQLSQQLSLQTYYANQILWAVIENTLNARAWRIRETGGATLQIQQIYFDVPSTTGQGDRALAAISYSEWMQQPNKTSSNQSLSGYFFNNQISPYLTLWPIPAVNNQFTGLLFTAYQYSQDVTNLFNQFNVPQRFYEALVAGITARLALKFAPDKLQMCKMDAQSAFQVACLTEGGNETLRFIPDLSAYRSS